jgi:hypothetical protein
MAVKAAVGRAPVRGRSGLRIGAKRSGGEAVGGGDAGAPFYRVGGGAGGWAMKGIGRRRWCAIMVVEAAVSGGDRPGLWWEVMRGGAPIISGA